MWTTLHTSRGAAFKWQLRSWQKLKLWQKWTCLYYPYSLLFKGKSFATVYLNTFFPFHLENLLSWCSLIAVVLVRLSRSASQSLREIPQATLAIWSPQYAHRQSILMSPQPDSDLVLILLHSHTVDKEAQSTMTNMSNTSHKLNITVITKY